MIAGLHVAGLLLCMVAATRIRFSVGLRGDEFQTSDGTTLYYKDWNSGTPIVFSHGWPQDADVWDSQMLFFGQQGYRVVAHDRRGFGRSQQVWNGNDMNTYADDLAQLIEKLDLKNVILIATSAGGGEVARYIGRHGTSRIAKVVLISAITPHLSASLPSSVFDFLRTGIKGQKPQFLKDLALLVYGFNRPNATAIQGYIDEFWLQGMLGSINAEYDDVTALGEDFTEDLKKIDKPTLVLHGDDDQIAPYPLSGALTAKLVPGATLKVYPGYSHGMVQLQADQINQDILAFLKQY